jgi:hypothetical protein
MKTDHEIPEQETVAEQAANVIPQSLALKHPFRLLWVVLLLGWTYNYLFWKQLAGVNFALFLTVSVIGGVVLLLADGYKPQRNSLWLLIPFLFFAIVTFTRQESLTIFLAFTFSLFSLGLLATSYLGGRWHLYRLTTYVKKFFMLIVDLILRPVLFFYQVSKLPAEVSKDDKRFPLAGVLRGLVIALPIVLCFGSLLASADLVFNQKINDAFDSEKISDYIQQFFIILFSAYFLAGVILHAATKSRDESVTAEDRPILKPFLGFAESAVVLGSVAFLFLSFVMIQFQYFFGGEKNIGIKGYSYSEYARRGFNELVIVAFFSLVLILGLSAITRRKDETEKRIYSGLSIAVVALVMVILVSAYQRVSLAIDWHGFSRLRLYPRVFLIWLGILLVAVGVLEVIRRERYFAFAALLASIGFSASLALVNVDAAIVRHNIPRVLAAKYLNVAHMASLSTDAVPALVDEFYSDAYPQSAHEGIGAALTCYLQRDNSEDDVVFTDWRSFNLSRWQAHIALQRVEKDLQAYSIKAKSPLDWDWRVRTPGNVIYPCRYYETTVED